MYCLVWRNVTDDVYFQIHFIDPDYLDCFSRYK